MSTRRRIEFELVGNAGNIEAVLNRLNTGITRTARGAQGVNRELGMMDRQMQAIRTTARYALAGGLVFGITGAISRLRDFQDRLAQVAALSGTVTNGSYQAPGAGFLNRVGDEALLMSNQLGIATADVQDYMSRFFSAFDVTRMGGDQKLEQLRQFVNEVGSLQASLGAEAGDPQQLAGGIAGLVRQIDPSGKNIGKNTQRVSGLIYQLLAATPNITGRDVARDVGRVGATMAIGNLTPEQAFAVWTQAGSAGGSSSVIGRGVAQLLGTSLLHPQTPAQQKAFQQVGLSTDPTTLRNMGGFQVLTKMLDAVAPNGLTVKNRAILGNEDIGDGDALAGAGVGKDVNLTLLYNLLGRQESVRQFINLLGAGGTKALQHRIEVENSAAAHAQQHERERAAQEQRALSRAGQALSNIPLMLARGLRPVLDHTLAPLALGVSNTMARHPRATQAAEAALGGALAFGAIRRFTRLRGKGGLGAAAGAAITAEELPNLLAGGAADGSRHNPFWVVIAPVSGTLNPGLGGGGGDTPIPGGGNYKKWAGRIAPWAAWAAINGGKIAAGTGAGAVAGIVLATNGDQAHTVPHKGNTFKLKGNQYSFSQMGHPEYASPLLAALKFAHMQANKVNQVTFSGQANADLTIKLVDAQGRTITVQEHKGVPVKMIPDKGVPTTQGKPGQRKGSH